MVTQFRKEVFLMNEPDNIFAEIVRVIKEARNNAYRKVNEELILIFGALASFVQGEIGIDISGLVIGFLFSPYGLPMIGATAIAFIELINEKIKAI